MYDDPGNMAEIPYSCAQSLQDLRSAAGYIHSSACRIFASWLYRANSRRREIFPAGWGFEMSVNDPISDMLTAFIMRLLRVILVAASSKIKENIARILQEEGYVSGYEVVDGKVVGSKVLRIHLKYVGERRERRPVITGLERVSRPGRRVYTGKQEIPWVLSGMGIAILSTPKGVMTGQRARQLGVGGEVLCKVW
jgi:small subunit ribosomal protein S8